MQGGIFLKTGIALLGTGVAGAFSIGVLKAMEELGIGPQIIVASGDAAFPAVLYASGCDVQEIEPLYTYYRQCAGRKHLLLSLWERMCKKDSLQRYVENQLDQRKVHTVGETSKPLALMMTDLLSGREMLIAPMRKSQSDELEIVPDFPLSEILCACARGIRFVTEKDKKRKLCPLGGKRANAFWALHQMGAQKVLGVHGSMPQKQAANKQEESFQQAMNLVERTQGQLEQMIPFKEDAVLFIPQDLQQVGIEKAVQIGYDATIERQQMLYDSLLFESSD